MKPKTGTSPIVIGIILDALGLVWLVSTLADGEPHSMPAGILIACVALFLGNLLLLLGLRQRRRRHTSRAHRA